MERLVFYAVGFVGEIKHLKTFATFLGGRSMSVVQGLAHHGAAALHVIPKVRHPYLCLLASVSHGNRVISICPRKPQALKNQRRFITNGNFFNHEEHKFSQMGNGSAGDFHYRYYS